MKFKKSKGKRQKAKGKNKTVGAGLVPALLCVKVPLPEFFIFAFCLLPFAF